MTDDSTTPGNDLAQDAAGRPVATTSKSNDWYAEGQTRVVEAGGIRVTVRYVGRKGRRARILIEAPNGTQFRDD